MGLIVFGCETLAYRKKKTKSREKRGSSFTAYFMDRGGDEKAYGIELASGSDGIVEQSDRTGEGDGTGESESDAAPLCISYFFLD